MRFTNEVGGDKNTTYEIIEWPTDDFLNDLSQEEFE
jgi:hypothetical protein